MRKIKKLLKLIKNEDFNQFLKFSAFHPQTIKKKEYDNIPEYIAKFEILNNEIRTDIWSEDECKEQTIIYKEETNAEWDIHLASRNYNIQIDCIDWFPNFSDDEDLAALHRFIWLFRAIVDTPEDREKFKVIVLNSIISWIENVQNKSKEYVHFEIWQTYTVVERCVNWLWSMKLVGLEINKMIYDSIVEQLCYILKHLEYYGEKFTGNHFCNDGRGLFICGSFLNRDDFRDVGRDIINHEITRVVPDSIFLREGSVHYQFLFTKWITECLLVAKLCGDSDSKEQFEKMLGGLIKGCEFFLIKDQGKWKFPLIGDISPDYNPEWLVSVPWVANFLCDGIFKGDISEKKGFYNLVNAMYDNEHQYEGAELYDSGNAEWGRISNSTYVVFSHVNHILYPNNLTGHFHHDTGAIVVYAHGYPLFIDKGRVNYGLEGRALLDKNYTGHNILSVDGYNPEIDMRSFYSDSFLDFYAGNKPELERHLNKIIMTIPSSRRRKKIGNQCRIIELKDKCLLMEDVVEGRGKHNIEVLYHVPDMYNIEFHNDSIMIKHKSDCFAYNIKIDNQEHKVIECVNSQYSTEYGNALKCQTIRISFKDVLLPQKVAMRLEDISEEVN